MSEPGSFAIEAVVRAQPRGQGGLAMDELGLMLRVKASGKHLHAADLDAGNVQGAQRSAERGEEQRDDARSFVSAAKGRPHHQTVPADPTTSLVPSPPLPS